MSAPLPNWRSKSWAVFEYVNNPLSLCPPVHVFERHNPHLALDYRHKHNGRSKQIDSLDKCLTRAIRHAYFAQPDTGNHGQYTKQERDDLDQRVKALCMKGLTVPSIATQLGVDNEAVRRSKRRLGFVVHRTIRP